MSSWLIGRPGGLATTAWRSWYWTRVRALSGLVSWWMILVARAKAKRSALISSKRGEGEGVGGRCFLGPEGVGDASHVAEVADGLAGLEAAGDLDDRLLAHPEDDEVGLGVEQDRPLDGVAPVVVMGQAAEAGLDPAGDHRDAGIGLAGPLAVGHRGAVRPQADPAAGAVGVVVADLLVGRVVVDHAVHVPGADAEEQARPAERPPGVGAPPVGLAEDRHPEAGRFQDPAEDAHGERRVVDVGIAADEHDVDRVPPPRVHLGPGRGQGGQGRSTSGRTGSCVGATLGRHSGSSRGWRAGCRSWSGRLAIPSGRRQSRIVA